MTVLGRKPWALTLPHKAPSVATVTGSGLTVRAEMPSRSRWAVQAARIGEEPVRMLGQAGDHRPGEGAVAHIGQRFGIDDIIAMARTQQFEKVAAAFRLCRSKPGELCVADLSAEAVDGLVTSPGVIHRDPGSADEPGAEHIAGLVKEAVLSA